MNMILLELFSGIGGFAKGLSEAGFDFEKVYFSEIDKHAIANYKYNFKEAEYVGSVKHVSGITRPSIITFGSPCQDFSLAGKRMGMEGQRSSLITEAIRLISEHRPELFIWENVKGAFSSNNGADFWAIVQAFANIGGYRLEWQLLNTAWFLPQNRERIYLVGHLAATGFGRVFPIGENISRVNEGATGTTVNTITAGGHSGGMHSSMTLLQVEGRLNSSQDGIIHGIEGISQCLSAGHYNVPKIATHYGHLNKEAVVSEISPTLKAESHGHEPMIICPTLHGFEHGTNGNLKKALAKKGFIRRLTEIECERLQGFPDDWTKYGDYNGSIKEISKTQRYKMLGNAVTVKVVEEIGKRLLNKAQ